MTELSVLEIVSYTEDPGVTMMQAVHCMVTLAIPVMEAERISDKEGTANLQSELAPSEGI